MGAASPACAGVRRIAWVSPVPPALCGIADYTAELLPYLGAEFEIDVIVDPAQLPVDPEFAARHRVVAAGDVLTRHAARPYDLFVHHVGNSSFHSYMLTLMLRCRGLVVLHDYHLAWLVVHAAVTGNWPTDLPTELETQGEGALARDLRAGRVGPWDILETAPLNGRLLAAADAVLVHSAWASRRVRARVAVPVLELPHLAPASPFGTRTAERARLHLPADRFIVSTLGLVGPTKRIPSLLRGIAALPGDVRERTLLCVVGDIVDGSAADLGELASTLGIGQLVRFVGHVPLHDLAAYGRAADVCVQLRYPTHGESSASLLRALATGTPCVVSDHGSIGEWPETIVVKVRTPEHEVEDLVKGLVWLYGDPASRQSVGESAAAYVAARHDIRDTAARYAAFIDLAIARRQAMRRGWRSRARSWLGEWTR
jgi:glycosyltransferase involved in cell wall biosynthesis